MHQADYGNEVAPFSVITDNDIKYPIADFNITPDIAIVDTDVVQSMPVSLVPHRGMDALTHSLEAYVSTIAKVIKKQGEQCIFHKALQESHFPMQSLVLSTV